MSKSKHAEAQIHFREGYDLEGFSSSKTSNVSESDSTTIIRELIQNSVDAAKTIDRPKTFIRFEIDEIDSSMLPGFPNIKEAFKQAVKTQEKLFKGDIPNVQQEIIGLFNDNLKKSKCSILSVSDNGVGLTQDKMQALLADGISAKESDGGGAHGYGHLTVLPSSGIRLVYYGGHSESEIRIGSGHCIVASFQDGQTGRNPDGYLVSGLKNDMLSPYEFLKGEDIPGLISEKLDIISKEWGSGTVVQVPFFNFFKRNRDDLWKLIKKAAATNFFACFKDDEIVVEYVHKHGIKRLDSGNIEAVLREFSYEKISGSFIAGSKALDCYETIKYGKEIQLKTDIGTVTARIRHNVGSKGGSRIDLCRNGMWIVYSNNPQKRLPSLQVSAFEGYEKFHLVILLKASDDKNHKNGKIHKLVRNAEPPLHDAVIVDRVGEKSKKLLQDAFKCMQKEIKEHLNPINPNVIPMDDFLKIEKEGDGQGATKDGSGGTWRRFERHMRPRKGKIDVRVGPAGPLEPVEHKNGKKTKTRRRGGTKKQGQGKPRPFQAVCVPTGARSYEFEIVPLEDLAFGNLLFKIDQSLDETCSVTSNKTHLSLKNIEVDGKPVAKRAYIKGSDNNVEGVQLDKIVMNETIRVKFDFDLSTHIKIPDDSHVGLEAMITARINTTESTE